MPWPNSVHVLQNVSAPRRTAAKSTLANAAGPCFACSTVVGSTRASAWLFSCDPETTSSLAPGP
eukprot:3178054-Lingulodinium_polyedra.AAC.1